MTSFHSEQVSLGDAIRHDAEIGAGLRHNEARTLSPVAYSEGVLKLLKVAEAAGIEAFHRNLMHRVPTGDPSRYSFHRSLHDLAVKQREAELAALGVPVDG